MAFIAFAFFMAFIGASAGAGVAFADRALTLLSWPSSPSPSSWPSSGPVLVPGSLSPTELSLCFHGLHRLRLLHGLHRGQCWCRGRFRLLCHWLLSRFCLPSRKRSLLAPLRRHNGLSRDGL